VNAPRLDAGSVRTRRFTGQPAAPGIALGRIVELSMEVARKAGPAAGHPGDELAQAIAQAVAQLEALMARAGGAAHSILDFQVEFLGDPVLLEPAHEALAAGADAQAAWRAAIDAQIADFEAATDDYFRHRAGDLRDMRARVLAILAGEDIGPLLLPAGTILLADDLAPSRFLATTWRPDHAIALRGGSPTAHVALLARAQRVPMVVGVGDVLVRKQCAAILDGNAGTLLLEPDAEQVAWFTRTRAQHDMVRAGDDAAAMQPAVTATGAPVKVLINIASIDELDRIDPAMCDGVGLVRTELLFAHGPPDEDTQFAFYRRILEWARARPVIIRTLDAGGDKPIPGVTVDGETNPFLGVRGVRLSLATPAVFKVQLRALLRAAVAGNLRVMLPMVTHNAEVVQVRALIDAAAAELEARGEPFARPPLGIMVEVPAAALALDAFDADFASIGSNDLLQYTMAAARDNPSVTSLADPRHPGFLALLNTVVQTAARRGLPLSLCGDLAAQPEQVALLLSAGLRALSMPASAVGAVKRAIAAWPAPAGS
jgi:phosphoenolpyruvate-protein phosphotransferase (PTS system enzyme I)